MVGDDSTFRRLLYSLIRMGKRVRIIMKKWDGSCRSVQNRIGRPDFRHTTENHRYLMALVWKKLYIIEEICMLFTKLKR